MDDLAVGASVCPVHCGKTVDRIPMPFGIIGRTGPRMRQIVGFRDRSTGRGTFGANLGRAIVTNGTLRRTCATMPRRGPLPNLLWANMLHVIVIIGSKLRAYCIHSGGFWRGFFGYISPNLNGLDETRNISEGSRCAHTHTIRGKSSQGFHLRIPKRVLLLCN